MSKLTDREIRTALIARLNGRGIAPRAVLEEVQVFNGNAIADVVAVYKTLHCYEIKGQTDSIGRITRQGQFYDQAFPLITLVTTENHFRRAIELCPAHWGIVLAFERRSEVGLRFERGASRNPNYRPEIALLSLWRSELIEFSRSDEIGYEKMNRKEIAALIAQQQPLRLVNESLGNALAARWERRAKTDNPAPCM